MNDAEILDKLLNLSAQAREVSELLRKRPGNDLVRRTFFKTDSGWRALARAHFYFSRFIIAEGGLTRVAVDGASSPEIESPAESNRAATEL